MLDALVHQGKFGEDYVRVLASAAGLLVSKDDVDHDGIDLCIKFPGRSAFGWSPRIDVQVKTTSRPRRRAAAFDFDGLNQSQFNRLAGPDFLVHRYLFLVIVPKRADEYAALDTGGLLLRDVGYYVSLRDHTPIDEPRSDRRIRVAVPTANVLTVTTLRHLITGETGGATQSTQDSA
ncbi:DUF4365 domain-containing protein [Kribbella sindirgiensis]|uniref:DUF4365 domain-containing protein n=1 Tax=Kribbella sindirgiensis TaxID=1124744 RepID=A0A4R0JC59_9ACTN|nr:DUF4365 domain-containing protein [Kribbella sindirgiensis]TCC43617.1 DUF4365 domain-containing protein [Kribbella sindirgiensis]